MLDIFFQDSQLCAPTLIILRQRFKLGEKLLDDMMLFISLKRDVFRLLEFLERRIKDFLFDSSMHVQLLLELREQLFAGFDAALGGRLQFLKDADRKSTRLNSSHE